MTLNFPKIERKILRFWKKNRVFEKSIEKRQRAPNFVFYEGPPTANARPGIHHLFVRVFKDIICRYKTMRGFKVLRKAGWDTHGLPVELEIEKKLELKSKKEIEKYGIAKFNKKCRESVWQYKKDWEKLTEKIAFWLDIKKPYITCQSDYIETVWWILKKIWQKGFLIQDYRVSPYCPRCQTVLSSHEVAQGYERIKEPAIYLKFPILNPEFKNTSLLVWTTTPWTLPGNVAVAVNPNFIYLKVKVNNEYLILAKERLKALNLRAEIVKEFKGKDLVGLRYEALYPFNEEVIKRAYRVILADFVSLEEGTGLVHLAPAFGEEDMIAGKKNNLPLLLTVDEEGKFKLEVKKWAGLFVKEADPLIIEDLKKRYLLFKEELYEHDYPFCWRCHSPLLYYAKESWFIRMTKLKKDLIRNNQKINWIPAHLKEGRFGQWLGEIKDWALTRERYWGTPLPIWRCKNCQHLEVIGSKKDLLSQKFSTNKYFILRHGQTIYQTKKRQEIYPYPEKKPIGLTTEGIKQIQKLAQSLKKKKIDLIYSSDFYRAKQTAQIVAQKLNLKINFDSRLGDVNLGIYHGKQKEKYYQEFPISEEHFEKKPPGGGSWLNYQKRMIQFLKEIDKKNQNKRILIISHGDPLWLLEGAMKGKTKKSLIEERKKKGIIKTGEIRKLEFKSLPFNEKIEIDFHRPYIDEVKFYCPRCKVDLMKRTPDVIDCWFDSGSMPFAQYHYPFEKKDLIDQRKLFPGDFISEGVDQTRGWFYTLHAISTLLRKGPSYKNVISLGHVLDEKGEKMSKSKGNVVDPWYIIEKYGVDSTRWYFYTINQPGDPKLFTEKDVEKALKKFILTLWNSFLFYQTYKESSKLKTQKEKLQLKTKNLLDKWVISKLNQLILETTNALEKYDVTRAARVIENFVINDLSLWYIRRSRPRFQKPKTKRELKEASEILNFVFLILSKLTAPFIPFLSEEIYKRIVDVKCQQRARCLRFCFESSVHLESWPKVDKKLINKKLEKRMEEIREVVFQALSERAKYKIKIRQPLKKLQITNYKLEKEKELLELIKEEVNVKEITFGQEFKLDREITPELKEEGIVREVIRNIQEMRKIACFKPKNKILVNYWASDELKKILEKNKNFILKEGKIKNLITKEKTPEGNLQIPIGQARTKVFAAEKEILVDQQKLWLAIKPC